MAFVEIERLENEAIARGISGAELGDFLYSLPFKSDFGVVECRVPDCKYQKKGYKHIHQTGVSAAGIDEIARIYEGIQAFAIDHQKIRKDGKYYIRSTAMARDVYTGNLRTAIAEQPCTSKRGAGDPRASFDEVIADRKAVRNAIRQILPQALMAKILQWAKEGKRSFTEDDAQRLIDSIGASRRNRTPKFFLSGVETSMALLSQPSPEALPAPEPEPTRYIEAPVSREPSRIGSAGVAPPVRDAQPEPIRESRNSQAEFSGNDDSPVVNFGKYKGKTLMQIYQEDDGYVTWLSTKANDPDIKAAALRIVSGAPQEINNDDADRLAPIYAAAKAVNIDDDLLDSIVMQDFGCSLAELGDDQIKEFVASLSHY
jgi:hypothetical protein